MTQPPGDQPKIIVDEDWKTQVAREKQQQQASSRGEADNAAVPHPATAAESPARARRQPLPPASFSSLVRTSGKVWPPAPLPTWEVS